MVEFNKFRKLEKPIYSLDGKLITDIAYIDPEDFDQDMAEKLEEFRFQNNPETGEREAIDNNHIWLRKCINYITDNAVSHEEIGKLKPADYGFFGRLVLDFFGGINKSMGIVKTTS